VTSFNGLLYYITNNVPLKTINATKLTEFNKRGPCSSYPVNISKLNVKW